MNQNRQVTLIGAPTDIGASTRGASMGPEALRVAGIEAALRAHDCEVIDRGDVSGPRNPWLAPVDGYRHLAEVAQWSRAVHEAIYAELVARRVPILLGGDHSLAIGSISAAARHCREQGKRLRVLWFDAHADFNTSEITPSGNIHGMPAACLCGIGPPELIEIGGHVPAIQPAWLHQIGVRSVDPGEKRLVHAQGPEVYDMRYVDEVGMKQVMTEAIGLSKGNTHLHVSLDIDFLDPGIAPGVGTQVRGGPLYREVHLCMEMIADTGHLASLDVVELNPAFDHRNETALLAVELVESLFGKSTLMRR
jgi:arginase